MNSVLFVFEPPNSANENLREGLTMHYHGPLPAGVASLFFADTENIAGIWFERFRYGKAEIYFSINILPYSPWKSRDRVSDTPGVANRIHPLSSNRSIYRSKGKEGVIPRAYCRRRPVIRNRIFRPRGQSRPDRYAFVNCRSLEISPSAGSTAVDINWSFALAHTGPTPHAPLRNVRRQISRGTQRDRD